MFRPSEEMYESLLSFAMSKGSFDGKKSNTYGQEKRVGAYLMIIERYFFIKSS